MYRLLPLAPLLIALASLAATPASAQEPRLRLLDSILIHSEAAFNVDRPINRVFGFGGEYTDSIDYLLPSATRERELPGAPPATLYAMFDAQNVPTPAWIDRDVRGIPDSVASGRVSRFALRYVLGLSYGVGRNITLVMPRALPVGIDSINVRDIIGGTGGFLFSTTLKGNDSVAIPSGLELIALIVYYDAADMTASVDEPIADGPRLPGLRLAPNPARDRVSVGAELAAGSRVVVSDLRGTAVVDERIEERGAAIAVEGLAPGVYFVRAVGADGSIVAEDRLVVAR